MKSLVLHCTVVWSLLHGVQVCPPTHYMNCSRQIITEGRNLNEKHVTEALLQNKAKWSVRGAQLLKNFVWIRTHDPWHWKIKVESKDLNIELKAALQIV